MAKIHKYNKCPIAFYHFHVFLSIFFQFAIKIDQTEAFLQNPHEFESTEALQSLLQLHDRHAKGKKWL